MKARVSRLIVAYRLQHAPHVLLGLGGTLCCVAYTWLMILSWQQVAVDLRLFFLMMSLAWGVTLTIYVTQHDRAEALPCNHMLVWAMLFRVLGLLGHPVLEDDYFRYLWDGRTFAVSGNPYGDRPADHFTDIDLPLEFHTILDHINYPHIPTIYGPVCQYAFLVSYWLAPGTLFPLKLLFVLADVLTLCLLLKLSDPTHTLLYAWCPLVVKETAFTAHTDALGVLFLVAALYACTHQRGRFTALFAALAVGTKILAALLVPFLLSRIKKEDWLLFGGILVVVYMPFLVQSGPRTMAGMAAFLQVWEFNSSGYGLLTLWLASRLARVVCATFLGAFCLGYLWRYYNNARLLIPRGDWLYGVCFLLSPVLNPWYLLWLLPFVTLFPSAWGVTALVAVSVSYTHGLYIDPGNLSPYSHPAWVRPLEFGVIALAGAYDLWRYRHAPSKRHV